MLNWICPECGRENDPTLQECPCAKVEPLVWMGRLRPRQSEPDAAQLPAPDPGTTTASIQTPRAPESAIAAAAPEVPAAPEPGFAPYVAIRFSSADDCRQAPELAAMLQAITTEPAPLAPAVEEDSAGRSSEAAMPLGPLCGPMPGAGLAISHLGWSEARQNLTAAELPEQPSLPDALPRALEMQVPLRSDEMIAVREPKPCNPQPKPIQPNAFARARRRLAFPCSPIHGRGLAQGTLCGSVAMVAPAFEGRRLTGRALRNPAAPVLANAQEPALPSSLRRFLEAVVPRIAYARRPGPVENAAVDRGSIPAWIVSLATALGVLLMALVALQRFGWHEEVQAATTMPAAASTVAAPATGAWPSIDRFVEVTGLRLTTDQKSNSEAIFAVVNHSSADVGGLVVKVSLPSAKAGEPPVFDLTANVAPLAPWEAREFRMPLPRELHASELPDWHDLHTQVQITSVQ